MVENCIFQKFAQNTLDSLDLSNTEILDIENKLFTTYRLIDQSTLDTSHDKLKVRDWRPAGWLECQRCRYHAMMNYLESVYLSCTLPCRPTMTEGRLNTRRREVGEEASRATTCRAPSPAPAPLLGGGGTGGNPPTPSDTHKALDNTLI